MKERNSLKTCLMTVCCTAGFALMFASADSAADSSQRSWQSLDSIRETAQNHVAQQHDDMSGSTQVSAARLDERLHLEQCPVSLKAESPWAANRNGRVTVRVFCDAEPSWRVHVPVDVIVKGQVVTSTRALSRGTILSSEDVAMKEMELGGLGHGYFSDMRHVVGQQLKRPLAPGSVVTPAQLESPAVIRRGQSVTIIAGTAGIAVKMQGTALDSGAIGQVIDIENNSSGRRVQGVIRSARSVEILLR